MYIVQSDTHSKSQFVRGQGLQTVSFDFNLNVASRHYVFIVSFMKAVLIGLRVPTREITFLFTPKVKKNPRIRISSSCNFLAIF